MRKIYIGKKGRMVVIYGGFNSLEFGGIRQGTKKEEKLMMKDGKEVCVGCGHERHFEVCRKVVWNPVTQSDGFCECVGEMVPNSVANYMDVVEKDRESRMDAEFERTLGRLSEELSAMPGEELENASRWLEKLSRYMQLPLSEVFERLEMAEGVLAHYADRKNWAASRVAVPFQHDRYCPVESRLYGSIEAEKYFARFKVAK